MSSFSRRSLLKSLALGSAALTSPLLFPSCTGKKKQPNVVIVMTDDQGYGDLSAHGHPYLKTPHLDALRQKSIRLTDFHVAPVCAPTRSQLLTGIDALHNGAYNPHGQRFLLNKRYTLLSEVFAENNYNTALYGKWHLGGNFVGYRPHERGFDDAVHFLRGGHWSHPNPWNSDCWDDTYYHNGNLQAYKGYATDLWFELGRDFVSKSKKDKKPFFLYLAINPPHLPWLVPEKYRTPYLGRGLDKESINFYGMINNADENIGHFIQFLKNENVWDDTIFIFMTDNGSTLWHQEYNGGLPGKKGSVYDGGHRVPCFVSWPNGSLGLPREIDELTQVQDLFPSLVDLCDLRMKADLPFEGKSLKPLLKGESPRDLKTRMLVVQHEEKKYNCAVMWTKWRLVNGTELYYLDNDMAQERNVAAENPEMVQIMQDYYEEWWKTSQISNDPQPYIIGADDDVVQLTAYDWYWGDRVINWPHLRRGDKKNGKYKLHIQRTGQYKITLRRWPRDADAGIRDSVPAYMPFDSFLGELPEGKKHDIQFARIHIAEHRLQQAVKIRDKEVEFTLNLKEGETYLQTWFIDSSGDRFGAYYAYLQRLKP